MCEKRNRKQKKKISPTPPIKEKDKRKRKRKKKRRKEKFSIFFLFIMFLRGKSTSKALARVIYYILTDFARFYMVFYPLVCSQNIANQRLKIF